MDSTCISGVVILLIVSSMILLAFEADSCARYGLHDIPDSFMWANLVVFLLFTLEMGFRLRRCPRPEVLLVLDMVVIFMQAVDVGVSLVARFAAGSEVRATAYLRIAQYLRWFRIVRCLHFIPAFASMKAGVLLDLKRASPRALCVIMQLTCALCVIMQLTGSDGPHQRGRGAPPFRSVRAVLLDLHCRHFGNGSGCRGL